jgi:hypothetical protein
MAKVPLPERGQPLDLTYIRQLATAVNDLSTELSPSVGRYTTIDSPSGTQRIRTSDSRVVGAFITVTNTYVTADDEEPFAYSFSDFAYPPIVTATPVLLDDSPTKSGEDLFIVLTRVTTNRVEGIVKFKTTGAGSIGINLIMVGVPV